MSLKAKKSTNVFTESRTKEDQVEPQKLQKKHSKLRQSIKNVHRGTLKKPFADVTFYESLQTIAQTDAHLPDISTGRPSLNVSNSCAALNLPHKKKPSMFAETNLPTNDSFLNRSIAEYESPDIHKRRFNAIEHLINH